MSAASHIGSNVGKVPCSAHIVGLRLHARRVAGALGASEAMALEATALLDLGRREAARQAAQQAVQDLVTRALEVVASVPARVGARLDEVAALAVELGLQIAREVVGNALDRGFVDPTPVVARCLRDCVHGSDRSDLVVRVHPEDLALVQAKLDAMPELCSERAATRFVADGSVARGGVRAETEAGRLRYDPREALERVCAEVRREVSA